MDIQNSSPSKEIASVESIINIDHSKNLDDADDGMNKPGISGPGPLKLRVLDEVPGDSKESGDKVEHVLHVGQETPIEDRPHCHFRIRVPKRTSLTLTI